MVTQHTWANDRQRLLGSSDASAVVTDQRKPTQRVGRPLPTSSLRMQPAPSPKRQNTPLAPLLAQAFTHPRVTRRQTRLTTQLQFVVVFTFTRFNKVGHGREQLREGGEAVAVLVEGRVHALDVRPHTRLVDPRLTL